MDPGEGPHFVSKKQALPVTKENPSLNARSKIEPGPFGA